MNSKRTLISTINNTHKTGVCELFQNNTLRPILKQLNELWKLLFLHSCSSNSLKFNDLARENKITLINSFLSKNQNLKNQLIGMVIGQFEQNELKQYLSKPNEYNKRILQMLKERLTDQLTS